MIINSSSSQFHHSHNFLGSEHDRNARRTLWVVALTAVMMIGEIVAGYITGSMALLADGFHMATHAGALSIAASAYAFSKRHAENSYFSFGTGKVGDLAGFASALILGVVALGIGVESVKRLIQPAAVDFSTAIWIALVGLLVNIASAMLLSHSHSHSHHEHGHGHGHDNNLRAAYMHVLADAFTSLLAIAALIAGRYLGWLWMDAAMGIVGAVVIARWSWKLMLATGKVLLDATNSQVAIEIHELVEGPGDAKITDLHVWQVGPEALSAIVSVTGVSDPDIIRSRLHSVHEIAHLTIETH